MTRSKKTRPAPPKDPADELPRSEQAQRYLREAKVLQIFQR